MSELVANKQKSLLHTSIFPWMICGIAALFYCYAYFLRVSPSVMMGDLLQHLQINAAQFGNLTAFYYYAYDPMQLPVGVIIDRYGAKLVLFIACLLATAGLAIFIAANQLPVASAGRFLIGFGSAFAYVTVLKLATIWLPPNRFAIAAGLTTSFGMLAAMFSDQYLTTLVQAVGYKHALYSSLVAGIILSGLILFAVKNRPKSTNQATRSLANNNSKVSFADLMTGLKEICKSKQMWLIGLIGCLLYLPASVFLDTWGIPYLETTQHLTPGQAANAVSMVFIGWIIASPIIGGISDRIRLRCLPLTIASSIAFITICLVFYIPHLSIDMLYLLMFIFGMFCGSHPLTFSLSKESNPMRLAGTAVATTNTLIMVGGVIFQPLVGLILVAHTHAIVTSHGIPSYSSQDYQWALSIIPLALLASAILTLFLKETHCQLFGEDTKIKIESDIDDDDDVSLVTDSR